MIIVQRRQEWQVVLWYSPRLYIYLLIYCLHIYQTLSDFIRGTLFIICIIYCIMACPRGVQQTRTDPAEFAAFREGPTTEGPRPAA